MAKTQEELNKIKEEYKALAAKLKELSEDELRQVIGGMHNPIQPGTNSMIHAPTYSGLFIGEEINPASTKGCFGAVDQDNKH